MLPGEAARALDLPSYHSPCGTCLRGSTYDHLFRCGILARKALIGQLLSCDFTVRHLQVGPRDTHNSHTVFPRTTWGQVVLNPCPPVLGRFQGLPQFQLRPPARQLQPLPLATPKPPGSQEICRNCGVRNYVSVRTMPVPSHLFDFSDRHLALQYTHYPVSNSNQGQGGPPQSHNTTQAQFNCPHPYVPTPSQGAEQV